MRDKKTADLFSKDPKKPTPSYIRDAAGRYQFKRKVTNEELLEIAMQALESDVHQDALSNPSQTRDYLRLRLGRCECEFFGALYLDNRHRVIACEEIFRGTIDGASVHPREVVKDALKHNAAAIIFYHNHPSGVCEPSRADQTITSRLKEALSVVDIRVLDHYVVSQDDSVSFAERGLL
jgi:DNA repair protein RadC